MVEMTAIHNDREIKLFLDGIGLNIIVDDAELSLQGDLEEWFGSPEVRTNSRARLWADGDFPERTTRGARFIPISGTATALTTGSVVKIERQLASLLRAGQQATLRVEDSWGEPRSAVVQLSSKISISHPMPNVIGFDFVVKANDPLKYADPFVMTIASTPRS